MLRFPILLATAALAAACSGPEIPTGPGPIIAPSQAELACLDAVGATTRNPETVLLSSVPADGDAITVLVGVGSQRAPWSCTATPSGETRNVFSMTDEGAA